MNENVNDSQIETKKELEKAVGARVEPILAHLNVEGVDIDKDKIRALFIKIWELEDGDTLDPEEQYLLTVCLFIYTAHVVIDDYSISVERCRPPITEALRAWMAPDLEKAVAAEKATDNPFKAFVDSNQEKVDHLYSWKNFMLDTKKADETEWRYKLGKCWLFQFFIRYGRHDFLSTGCNFCQIPAEMRKDYVQLELKNLFAKYGAFCQFKYNPVKK